MTGPVGEEVAADVPRRPETCCLLPLHPLVTACGHVTHIQIFQFRALAWIRETAADSPPLPQCSPQHWGRSDWQHHERRPLQAAAQGSGRCVDAWQPQFYGQASHIHSQILRVICPLLHTRAHESRLFRRCIRKYRRLLSNQHAGAVPSPSTDPSCRCHRLLFVNPGSSIGSSPRVVMHQLHQVGTSAPHACVWRMAP